MNYQFLHTKKTIFFRVDGDNGNNAGLGHIYRILKIYYFLKRNYRDKYNFIFLMKDYYIGKKIIKNLTKEKIITYKNKILNYKLFKPSDIVIIDTLGAESYLLKKIYASGIEKIVSFDETNLKRFFKGIIINGIYFSKKKIISKSNQLKVYQGPKYLVLNKNFSKKKVKAKIKKKITALISSGGTDKKFFLYKIVRILSKISNFKLIVLIGSGVKKNNLIFKIPKNKNIKLVKNTTDIKKYFDRADICFVSGGTVMFESICCGKLSFVCKTYENQKYAISYFKRKKLVEYMGNINQLKKNKIYIYIRNLNYLKKNSNTLFYKGSKLIDGKGIYRVNNIIKKLLI